MKGAVFVDGIALGHVVLHEPRIVVTQLIAEDVDHELRRLDAAMASLKLSVDDLLARGAEAGTGEHRDILEAYRMFAEDRGWTRRLQEAVRNGLTAEAAVERVQNDTRAQMARQTDPFLRDRLHDFDDLANRLLRELMGRPHGPFAADLPEDAIVVARNMGPADLLDYDRARLRGLVLEEAGPTSTWRSSPRRWRSPRSGQVEVVSLAEAGDAIIVDGDAGEVHLRPPNDIEIAYTDKVRFRARRQEQYRQIRDEPSVTRDGVVITLHINAGLLMDMPHLEESGAAGVGLFRTELQFMVASAFPRQNEQESFYGQVLEAANGKPVTFRSLDVGGDKVLPYFRQQKEENPAMGWRAIRLGLDRPALLAHAGAGATEGVGRTRAQADVPDGDGGRRVPARQGDGRARADASGAARPQDRRARHARRHDRSAVAACGSWTSCSTWSTSSSVGSNDLMQFMMASDRANTRIAGRFDSLSPAFLRALRSVTRGGRGGRQAGDALRGDCRPAARCHRACRDRLPLAVHGLGRHRPGEVRDPRARARPLEERVSALIGQGAAAAEVRGELRAWADANSIPI